MGAIFGQCPRCPKNSPTQRLYGGVCVYHFKNTKDDQSKQQIVKDLKIIEDSKLLKKWYAEQLLIAPALCENCGGKIVIPASVTQKAKVAHIIPKKHFLSVQTHPLNRWFGCWDCHTNYDRRGWAYAVNMNIWPVCVERFSHFMYLIKYEEMKHLPPQLYEVLHSRG